MAEGMDAFIPRPGLPGHGAFVEERVFADTANDPGDRLRAAPRDNLSLADPVEGWEPRVEPGPAGSVLIRYPERGDRCAVTEDNNGNYWVLGWNPYA